MLEIVAAEGPMRASRAYALYNRASGGKKLTTIARAPLSSSVHWLAPGAQGDARQPRRDPLAGRRRHPDARPAGRTGARARARARSRRFRLDEIAELMRRLRDAGHAHDEASLKRAVLSTYGLVRLTQRADEYLGLAAALL